MIGPDVVWRRLLSSVTDFPPLVVVTEVTGLAKAKSKHGLALVLAAEGSLSGPLLLVAHLAVALGVVRPCVVVTLHFVHSGVR